MTDARNSNVCALRRHYAASFSVRSPDFRRVYRHCVRVRLPSIGAVIHYAKRAEARGTYLESHFRWQIRTFWFTLLWCAVGALMFATVIGTLVAIPMFIAVGVWVIYRVVRGWLALKDGKPVGKIGL